MAEACDDCLNRTALLGRLAGHLEVNRKHIWELLALDDTDLIRAVGGGGQERLLDEHRRGRTRVCAESRGAAAVAGLDLLCRCSADYPADFLELEAPPAVVHVAGGFERLVQFSRQDPVAIVGARRPNAYGAGVARSLGRGLATAGITVVSGLASGIDAAAHEGALESSGLAVAVLPGSADRPYPTTNAGLHRRIVARGVAISEMPPGVSVRKWMFVARNRLIAGLSQLTLVVQATERSGSLLTVRAAQEIGREVGAVPGPVTSQLSAGPNGLLRAGARVITGPQDVVDALGLTSSDPIESLHFAIDDRPAASAEQQALLEAIADGADTASALLSIGESGDRCLAILASLELSGRVVRGPGGRLILIP